MIQNTLPVIIISLQINIVSQEYTNTQDTIGTHKPIAWAKVTFKRATLLFMCQAHHSYARILWSIK